MIIEPVVGETDVPPQFPTQRRGAGVYVAPVFELSPVAGMMIIPPPEADVATRTVAPFDVEYAPF
jgi:hypothetical protein